MHHKKALGQQLPHTRRKTSLWSFGMGWDPLERIGVHWTELGSNGMDWGFKWNGSGQLQKTLKQERASIPKTCFFERVLMFFWEIFTSYATYDQHPLVSWN